MALEIEYDVYNPCRSGGTSGSIGSDRVEDVVEVVVELVVVVVEVVLEVESLVEVVVVDSFMDKGAGNVISEHAVKYINST